MKNRPAQQNGTLWRIWLTDDDRPFARQVFTLLAEQRVGWIRKAIICLVSGVYSAAVGLLVGWVLWRHEILHHWISRAALWNFAGSGFITGVLVTLVVLLLVGKQLTNRRWLLWLLGYGCDELDFLSARQLLLIVCILNVLAFDGMYLASWRFSTHISTEDLFTIVFCGIIFLLCIGFLCGVTASVGILVNALFVTITLGLSVITTDPTFALESTFDYWLPLWIVATGLPAGVGGLAAWLSTDDAPVVRIPITQSTDTDIEQALRLVRVHDWDTLIQELDRRRQQPNTPPALIDGLTDEDWKERFLARHLLISLGGEAVPVLWQKGKIWILEQIGRHTTTQWASRTATLLCPQCWVHYARHRLRVTSWSVLSFYGCRQCGQSRSWQAIPDGLLVAVLNSRTQDGAEMQGERNPVNVYVNVLTSEVLPDADRIDIRHASDEEVHRFVMRIANDMDAVRRRSLMQAHCVVSCMLLPQTLNLLRGWFQRVEIAFQPEEAPALRGVQRARPWRREPQREQTWVARFWVLTDPLLTWSVSQLIAWPAYLIELLLPFVKLVLIGVPLTVILLAPGQNWLYDFLFYSHYTWVNAQLIQIEKIPGMAYVGRGEWRDDTSYNFMVDVYPGKIFSTRSVPENLQPGERIRLRFRDSRRVQHEFRGVTRPQNTPH